MKNLEPRLLEVERMATENASAVFELRDASVGGNGLQPGLHGGSWEDVRALIYEGRGEQSYPTPTDPNPQVPSA